MCSGGMRFFAKVFLRLSLGLACAQKRTGRMFGTPIGRAADGAVCYIGILAHALGERSFIKA